MRLLYIAQHHPRAADGVTRKLLSQVAAWRRLGHEVELRIVSPEPVTAELLPTAAGRVITYRGARGALDATREAARDARRGDWQAVYLRYTRPWPAFKALARELPVCVELNGSEPVLGRASHPAWLVPALTWPTWHFLRQVRGVFTVSHHVTEEIHRHGIAAEVVPNGVDLDRVPEGFGAPSPGRMVFAGSGDFAWNGLDKLSAALDALPWLHLDIIGKDVAPPGIATHPRVRVHGPLQDSAYFDVLHRASVGIGPLALHRRGLRDTSSLKLGEYLATGLPVILGHDDPLLTWIDQPGSVLMLDNTEANVAGNLPAIAAFVQQGDTKRVSAMVRQQIAIDRLEAHRMDIMARWLAHAS